jgi:hypothetical protein
VEGTLEARKGWQGIPLDHLRKLREEGVIIYIVGAYDALASTTTEFENGWYGPDKVSSLNHLAELYPDIYERIYVGDKSWDMWAANEAGWPFVVYEHFNLFLELVEKHGFVEGFLKYSKENLEEYDFL